VARTREASLQCPSCGYSYSIQPVPPGRDPIEATAARPPSTLTWLRSYTSRAVRQWPLWSMFLLFSWAIWAGGQTATILFAMIAMFIALRLMAIAIECFPLSSTSGDPRLALVLLGVLAVLSALGVLWGFLGLVRLIDILAGGLQKAGFSVDQDILTTAVATAIATLLAVAVTAVLSRRPRHLAAADHLVVRYWRLALEASWTLGLITVALIPAVVRGRWFPNVSLGLFLPLLVLHAREDHRAFRERGQAEPDRALGRVLEAFVARVSRMRVARAYDSYMSPERTEADFRQWLLDTPKPWRRAYVGLWVVYGLYCIVSIGRRVWSPVASMPVAPREFLLFCFLPALVIVVKGVGPPVWRTIQGLWQGR
jgi:hypothetical protein